MPRTKEKRPARFVREEIEELIAYGYTVKQFSPYHWRVSHPDYEMKIELWPTARKFAINRDGQIGYSREYRDIIKEVHGAFK